MNKKDIDYEKIREFLKTPRGKACLFFGFYFIFFFVLIVMIRSSYNGDSYDDVTKEKDLPFSIGMIENGNYHFKYLYNFDDNEYLYEGDKDGSKELFKFSDNEYYHNNDIYLINNSGMWIKTDNPYKMEDFINISKIKKILKKATYISKTDYESGMKVYNYQISTSTLVKILSNISIDLDDKPNEIIVKTDDQNNANVIKFEINSYSIYNNLATTNGEIELNYSKFGEVKKIKDPE